MGGNSGRKTPTINSESPESPADESAATPEAPEPINSKCRAATNRQAAAMPSKGIDSHHISQFQAPQGPATPTIWAEKRIKSESYSPPPLVALPVITSATHANQRILQLADNGGHYISHPVDVPPPGIAADMTTVGLSTDGSRVVLKAKTGDHGLPIRPGTPIPPAILHTQCPRTLPSAPPNSPANPSVKLKAGDEPYVTIRRLFGQRLDERLRELVASDESEDGSEMDVEEGEIVKGRDDVATEDPSAPTSATTCLGHVGSDKADASSEAELADVSSDEERDQWASDRRRPIPLTKEEAAIVNRGYRNEGQPNKGKLSIPHRASYLPRLRPILPARPLPLPTPRSSPISDTDSLPPLRPCSPVTSDEVSPTDESSSASETRQTSNGLARGMGKPTTTDGTWVRKLSEEEVAHNAPNVLHQPRPLHTRNPFFLSAILNDEDDVSNTTSEPDAAALSPPIATTSTAQPRATAASSSAAPSADTTTARRLLPPGKVLLPTYEVALAVKDVHHSMAAAAVGREERASAHAYTQRALVTEGNHRVRVETMEDQWAVVPAHEFLDIAGTDLRVELNHTAMAKITYINDDGLAMVRDRERLDPARVRDARAVTIYLDDILLASDDPLKRLHLDPLALDSVSTAEGPNMRCIDAAPVMTPLHDGEVARQFSEYARRRGAAYCTALNVIRVLQSKYVEDLARARARLLEFLDRLIALGSQRRIHQQPAVIYCPSPHPSALLKVSEFDRIRIAHAGFHNHGYHMISEVLSRVLHVQFKREEVISHLLYAGVLDTSLHTDSQVLGPAFHYPLERPTTFPNGAPFPGINHRPPPSVAPVRPLSLDRQRDSGGEPRLPSTRRNRDNDDRRRVVQMGGVTIRRTSLTPSNGGMVFLVRVYDEYRMFVLCVAKRRVDWLDVDVIIDEPRWTNDLYISSGDFFLDYDNGLFPGLYDTMLLADTIGLSTVPLVKPLDLVYTLPNPPMEPVFPAAPSSFDLGI
ncbi:hypothetical protein R3P38DRAFT_2810286 [Favolaschia claudopus]|uniref:Uncharacterized protein n=1 Tax=Favolaschia claudopus TaxID=2862362 RepID=A0AAV9ZCN8_9AGAR